MAEYVLGALFTAWLLATVVCQIPSKVQDWLRRYDIFVLIPRWHFFAPTPGMQDFKLVYRDRTLDGSLSPWREAPRVPICHQPLCAVWNPGRRHTKAVLDITKDMMQLLGQDRQELEIQLSIPYLALLNYVASLPRMEAHCSTQFALVMTKSSAVSGTSNVVFVSSLHVVE